MRLIDADKLELDIIWSDYYEGYISCYREEEIDNAPTVDAEVIRHGQWIEDSHFMAIDEYGNKIYFVEQRCSVCKHWNIKIDSLVERKYCPNCGARMDGE